MEQQIVNIQKILNAMSVNDAQMTEAYKILDNVVNVEVFNSQLASITRLKEQKAEYDKKLVDALDILEPFLETIECDKKIVDILKEIIKRRKNK